LGFSWKGELSILYFTVEEDVYEPVTAPSVKVRCAVIGFPTDSYRAHPKMFVCQRSLKQKSEEVLKIKVLGDYKNAIRDKETIIYGNMVR
jgi:hypothetical protein